MAKLISEKAAEILFNRFMLQGFGLGGAQLFAPSSVEEFHRGYDAKVVGFGAVRELYLQFKAPTLSLRDGRFTVSLTPHQHVRLHGYGPGSAFYVAGMFTSLEHFNQAQRDVKTAEDFLRHFVCIDVSALPADARAFTFGIPESHRHSPEPGFKTAAHGRSPSDYMPLTGHWERGNTLVAKLKQGQVGRYLALAPEEGEGLGLGESQGCTLAGMEAEREPGFQPDVTGMSEDAWRSMGTFVRVPA